MVICILCVGYLFNIVANHLVFKKIQQHALAENIEIDAEHFDLSILGRGPSIEIEKLRVKESQQSALVETADLSVRLNWLSVLTGNLTPASTTISNARISATSSKDATNWSALHSLLLKLNTSGSEHPISGQYQVTNTKIDHTNLDTASSASLFVNSHVFLNDTPSQSTVRIFGFLDQEPVAIKLNGFADSFQDIFSTNTDITVKAAFKNVLINGNLKLKPNEGLNTSIFSGNFITTDATKGHLNSAAIQRVETFPDVNITFESSLSASNFELNTLDILAPRSNLTLTAALNKRTDVTTFNVSARSNAWHTGDFPLSIFSSKEEVKKTTESTSLFSPVEPYWHTYMSLYEGTIDVQLQNFQTPDSSLVHVNSQTEIKNSTATSQLNLEKSDGGQLDAEFRYSLNETGVAQGSTFFNMQDIEISDLPFPSLATDIIPSGSFMAQGEFWFAGKTTADMAADLDGELYLLMESGELDALAVEVMGVDLMEVVRLLYLRDLQQIDIRCGYANISAKSGLITLEHLLLDSDDTLFSGKGNIDLNKESINVVFTPKPHDASLLSAVTPVSIKGSLVDPKIRPGKRLYLKLATAAALAALTGPAATLIPFISLGKGKASENCADLFADF